MSQFTATGYIDYASGYIVANSTGTTTWSSATTWASMAWNSLYVNPMVYYTEPVDLGSTRYFNLDISTKANGTITYDVLTSNTSSFSTVYDRQPKTVSYAGAVSTSTTKKFGNYGISFSGTSTDSISLADDADFNYGTGVFTIEAWINGSRWDTGGPSNQRTIYAKTTQGTTGADRLELYVNSGVLSAKVGTIGISSSVSLSTGTWYHVAMSRDSGGTVRLYRNGYCDVSATASANVTTTASLYIGRTSSGIENSTSSVFWGYMDDVRVSNTCRYTGTQFTQVFTAPAATLVNDTSTVLLITGERGIVDTPNILENVTVTTITDGDTAIPAFNSRYVMIGINVAAGDRPTIYSSNFTPNTRRLDLLLDNVNCTTLTAVTSASTSSRVLSLGRTVSQVLAVFPQKSNGSVDVGILPVVASKTTPSIAWVKATEGNQDYVYGGAGAAFIDPTTLTDPVIDVMVHVLPEQYMSNGQLSSR